MLCLLGKLIPLCLCNVLFIPDDFPCSEVCFVWNGYCYSNLLLLSASMVYFSTFPYFLTYLRFKFCDISNCFLSWFLFWLHFVLSFTVFSPFSGLVQHFIYSIFPFLLAYLLYSFKKFLEDALDFQHTFISNWSPFLHNAIMFHG